MEKTRQSETDQSSEIAELYDQWVMTLEAPTAENCRESLDRIVARLPTLNETDAKTLLVRSLLYFHLLDQKLRQKAPGCRMP
jgi:hypothetical protein